MNARKLTIAFVLLTLTVMSGFALENLDLRFMLESGVNFEGLDFYNEDGDLSTKDFHFSGVSPLMSGFTAEVVFDKLGVGWTVLGDYDEGDSNGKYDFDTRLFMTWHLFGTQRFFDLWMEAGVGVAGSYDFDEYEEFEECYEEDEDNCDIEDFDFLDMSVYSHLAVGLAVNPVRFLTVGARVSWRPVSRAISHCDSIDYYETPMFQAGLFVGLSFNISKNRNAEEEEVEAAEAEEVDNDNAAEAAEKAQQEAEEALEEMDVEINGEKVTAEDGQPVNIHIENTDEVNINIYPR